MKRSRRWIASGATAAALAAAVTGTAIAQGGDEGDTPITGEELDQASAAALDHLGEGRVTDTEVEDDEGEAPYEVEVTLDDGSQVEVELDEQFAVVGQETEDDDDDDDDADDDDGPDDADDDDDAVSGQVDAEERAGNV